MTAKLIPFVFESTGVEIAIRPVSPILAQRAHQSVIKPLPPMEEIENPDGTKRLEPNRSHPDYLAAMEAYGVEVERISRNVYIQQGVVLHLNEEQKAEVDLLRKQMADIGVTLEDDDNLVYIIYRAIGSRRDYQRFFDVASGESQPTGPKSTDG
jgi:siroheme synthase (precorrin-2 oxidase/ferrochelatase)